MKTNKVGSHKTQVFAQGMKMVVRYHETNVVEFDDKKIVLKDGGWLSRTTKLRMNQAANEYGLGFMVVQKHGQWQVLTNGKTIDYVDGITLNRKEATR